MTQALVDAGFDVTGIDCSAELLEIARAAVPTAHFINASIYGTAIPECDAIVALGEPLTYHAEGDNADLRVSEFFQRASAVLPPGGVLIFDIIECGEPSLNARVWSNRGSTGQCWWIPKKIRLPGRCSGISKRFVAQASFTGVGAKCIECACSIPED